MCDIAAVFIGRAADRRTHPGQGERGARAVSVRLGTASVIRYVSVMMFAFHILLNMVMFFIILYFKYYFTLIIGPGRCFHAHEVPLHVSRSS